MSSNSGNIREHEQQEHRVSNEKLLFLHNKRTGLAPYTHKFIGEERDPHLMASFVSAMSNFMEEMIGFEQKHWRAEYGSEVTLIVESGDWIVGCLAVSRETHEVRSKLRRVVREFEDGFALLRDATSFEGAVFSDFDGFVSRVFFEGKLTESTRIWRVPDWSKTQGRYVLPSLAYRIKNFLQHVEDGISISSLAEKMHIPYEECSSLVALSVWNNVAHLQYVPTKYDILSISAGSISTLLNKHNPLSLSSGTILVASLLDGRQPL
ncbi:MAG: hypothetical protein P1Q69_15540, partial [Candidatus Thorarchaeota archaeon]|nr:hypothetical protein [Candidatus Thorarchaeota archaeon]